MHAPSRKVIFPSIKGTFFPFGRSQSRNLLEDFHPEFYPNHVAGAYTDLPSNIQSADQPPAGAGPGPQVQMADLAATDEPLPPEDETEAPIASNSSSKTKPASKSPNRWASETKGKSLTKTRPVKRSSVPGDSDDGGSPKKLLILSGIPPSSAADRSPPLKKTAPPATDQKHSTSILLLRCSDLLETMFTLSAAPREASLDFYINNDCPLNGARNVLILKIILNGTLPIGDEDIQYLWDVWFNLSWSQDTTTRFRKDLQELINAPGDQVYDNIKWSGKASTSFQKVWNIWSKSVSVNGPLCNANVRTKIRQQRIVYICRGSDLSSDKGFRSSSQLNTESEKVVEKMVGDIGNIRVGEMDLSSSTSQCLSSWIKDGNINPPDYKKEEFCLNPTLLEQRGVEYEWNIHPKVNPLRDFHQSIPDDRRQYFARIILRNFIGTVRQRKEHISFHYLTEHPLELCFMNLVPPCHVIHGYDLAEEVGLANLLMASRRKLVPKLSSILLTEFFQSKFSDDRIFFQETLGFPVAMVPTIFGLELATPVQVLRPASQPDRKLSWR